MPKSLPLLFFVTEAGWYDSIVITYMQTAVLFFHSDKCKWHILEMIFGSYFLHFTLHSLWHSMPFMGSSFPRSLKWSHYLKFFFKEIVQKVPRTYHRTYHTQWFCPNTANWFCSCPVYTINLQQSKALWKKKDKGHLITVEKLYFPNYNFTGQGEKLS